MNKLLKNVVTIVVVVALVYYGNRGLNTYLGEQAVKELTFAVYTLEQAKEKASKEGKLVLADYSAVWCPSCRKLASQVFADADIAQQISRDFIYVRLDYDTQEGIEFAKTHDLIGFPRVLVINPLGEKLAEMPLTFYPLEYGMNLTKVTATFSQ